MSDERTARRPRRAPSCPGCNNELLLGKIDGTVTMILETQKAHGAKFDALDGRLRNVENRGAIAGAVAAILVAVGIDVMKARLTK